MIGGVGNRKSSRQRRASPHKSPETSYHINFVPDRYIALQRCSCCHSVGCGMTRLIMQSATRCRAAIHKAVIRVYDAAENMTETHEHTSDFKEW